MSKQLLDLLNNITPESESPSSERILLIDSLNLFFRNFSAINAVNSNGAHIGGVGGFLRSLGALMRQIQPTKVYMVFDGQGSSNNRKNIIPEYKSSRNLTRVTKHELFDNLEDEDESKISQIVRIIQYLKTLPVHTVTRNGVEADDIIAYLAHTLPQNADDRVFIVSSDKDYLQLVTQQIIVYRPIEKEYYTDATVMEKFNIPPYNFILYKVLMGDNSDGVSGIKGLGPKKLLKLFPELMGEYLSLDGLLDICENKLEEHIVYARVLHDIEAIRNKYTVMNLANPMMSEADKLFIDGFVATSQTNFDPDTFVEMYHDDQMGGLIRNVEGWIQTTFRDLLLPQN
jgi:DNA polymerase-1